MSSWIYICPGCEARFRHEQAFLWHTETCDDYLDLPEEEA